MHFLAKILTSNLSLQNVLSSKSELSQGEVGLLLNSFQSLELFLVVSKGSSDSSSLLVSQVSGKIFLFLEAVSNSFSVSLVDNSQVFSNGLSDDL